MLVGVVGAGAMGRGIAQVAAAAGWDVRLFDVDATAVRAAHESIGEGLRRSVARDRIAETEATAVLERIRPAFEIADLAGAELVIEAVVERLDVKQGVFERLEAVVAPDAILASNTSSLSIAAIARPLHSRRRVLGMHFFNPAPRMELVEVVPGPFTDQGVVARALQIVSGFGKVGVQVRDSPGFLVNLAGRAYVTEALAIIDEGVADCEQVDRIATAELGFPLGPFALMDLTGLDVNYPVTANIFEHNFADPLFRTTWYHRYLYEAGLLGRKSGRGFHRYDTAEEEPARPDPVADTADPAPPAPRLRVSVEGEARADLAAMCERAGIEVVSAGAAELHLVAPLGRDCSRSAELLGLDQRRTVGVDLLNPRPRLRTLMVGPGVDPAPVAALRSALGTLGPVELIRDSPGFVAQRLLASIVNTAAEIAQRGVARPDDIDTAVRLGLRYPLGPLEWGDRIGLSRLREVLEGMHDATSDPRYRVSPWLRRRAASGQSALTADFPSTSA